MLAENRIDLVREPTGVTRLDGHWTFILRTNRLQEREYNRHIER
jgi:hypothetical protein